MTKQHSFNKIENELLPDFRNKISLAESTEDVKKFFFYTIRELFIKAFPGEVFLEYEDISLEPGPEAGFTLSRRILGNAEFVNTWNASDLPDVVARFAGGAVNRYKHLRKKPEKTEAKIRA